MQSSNTPRVDICVPVHNEERILESNIRRLLRFCGAQHFPFAWRIVILVNGASDESPRIARRLAALEPAVNAVITPAPGRGRALADYWLQSPADIVTYMDSDLAVSLENLAPLLEPLIRGEADLAIGSRFKPGAVVVRSLLREASSRSYNELSRRLLGHTYSDLQCGFKAIRRDVFASLAPLIRDHHWSFDTELVVWAGRSGRRVLEVPVNWQETRFGSRPSKVRLARDTYRFLRHLLGFRRRLKRFKQNRGI